MTPGDAGHLESLRVQARQTIRRDGSIREERIAFCASQARWVSTLRCNVCGECAHLSGGSEPVLLCRSAPPPTDEELSSVRMALASAVWCIEAEALAALVRLMPEPQVEAVVVDADGHAIGLLAREAGRAAEGTAGSRMVPAVVSVRPDTATEEADEILATAETRTLPVVVGGRVVGRVAP